MQEQSQYRLPESYLLRGGMKPSRNFVGMGCCVKVSGDEIISCNQIKLAV